MARTARKPALTPAQLVEKHATLVRRGRTNYAKADAVFNQILDVAKPGDVIEAAGKRFEIVDNFAKSNTSYKAAGVRRFDLKELK